MLIICNLLFFLAASQELSIDVFYNDQTISIKSSDLTVNIVKSTFNISEFKCLEDLSGKKFYPNPGGSFPSSISNIVYVRQSLPKPVPTVIYPSESKFVYDTGPWHTGFWEVMVGYSRNSGNLRIGYIQFKDLNLINKKRKISKIYLRMVGTNQESTLPAQLFVHRCETDWQGIIHWNQQPIYRPEPYSSIIVLEAFEISFYWDVTDIVVDWALGNLPNYGIAIKANNTYGISTDKRFHNNDPVKKPALLVYYSD